MKITWREILIISLFLFIIIGLTWTGCNKINSYKQELARSEQNIEALRDTVKLIDSEKNIWSEKTVESNLKLLETLTVNDSLKDYINELKKENNLLAASKIEIEVRDTIRDTLLLTESNNGFKTYYIKDTSSNLKYEQYVTTYDSLAVSDLSYKYHVSMAFKYNRLKDGSIEANYAFNDPNIIVTKANSFYIPPNENKLNKTGKILLPIAAILVNTGISFYGGYRVGINTK